MLAPLLGASDSLVKALGLTLVLMSVVGLFNLLIRPLRQRLGNELQLSASIVLGATLTSCAMLFMQAWALELYQQLHLYLGLIALQCVVLNQRDDIERAATLRTCALFCLLLITMGTLREVLGSGSLGNQIQWLAGMAERTDSGWRLNASGGLHFFTLVPGAFILLGLLLAAKQAWASALASHRPISRK